MVSVFYRARGDRDPILKRTVKEFNEGTERHFLTYVFNPKNDVCLPNTATLEEYRKIDILINNAGIAVFVKLFDITEEIWDRLHAVNTKAVLFMTQAVSKAMIDRNIQGKIVNIPSISGEKATSPLQVS